MIKHYHPALRSLRSTSGPRSAPRQRAGALVGLQRDQVRVTVGGIRGRGQERIVRMGHLGFVEMMETIAAVTAVHKPL